jgi:hypothetical protein
VTPVSVEWNNIMAAGTVVVLPVWIGALAALKSQFDKMGIEVIAISDAGFNPERQVIDIRAVLAQNPQIIVSIPTDPDITAPAYVALPALPPLTRQNLVDQWRAVYHTDGPASIQDSMKQTTSRCGS